MGVDCDGVIRDSAENDGRCDTSKGRSDETAFQETLQGYKKGIHDMDPYVHSYIVLGNDGSEHGGITFDPAEYGIEPLSICAVVCNNKLVIHFSHLSRFFLLCLLYFMAGFHDQFIYIIQCF